MRSKVKKLLGFEDSVTPTQEEVQRDELIDQILESTTMRLKMLLGGVEEVPDELEYIVVEVAIKRFNRIGSEGVSSHGVEGESMTFQDNDFSEFKDDISEWRDGRPPEEVSKGKLRFL